ncbi:hypothetical protein ACQP2E_12535 [Actinoplanes sp. CA-015351]|uniref:hypothetical protein n=1 Tax=Actinoplanes sp. CA-015351 TaxID=3239897 RepID=UPI003D96BA8D
MNTTISRISALAALVLVSATAQACSSGTTTTTTAPSDPAGTAATATAATAATATAATAATAAAPAAKRVEPVVKSAPRSKPAGKKPKLPEAQSLVTVTAADSGASITDLGKGYLSASKNGTALQFHLIHTDDKTNNYQFSLAGPKNLCLEQALDPFGSLRLKTCDIEKAEQLFVITPAADDYYIGSKHAEYLYQGAGDVASFDVTPDFEPGHWTFVVKGSEPLD